MAERTGFTIYEREEPILYISWEIGDPYSLTFEKKAKERPIELHSKIWDGLIDWVGVMKFLESRSVPRTRVDIEDILRRYGLREYDALQMCKKSHGRSMSDYLWLKFDGENISYADVKLRD